LVTLYIWREGKMDAALASPRGGGGVQEKKATICAAKKEKRTKKRKHCRHEKGRREKGGKGLFLREKEKKKKSVQGSGPTRPFLSAKRGGRANTPLSQGKEKKQPLKGGNPFGTSEGKGEGRRLHACAKKGEVVGMMGEKRPSSLTHQPAIPGRGKKRREGEGASLEKSDSRGREKPTTCRRIKPSARPGGKGEEGKER